MKYSPIFGILLLSGCTHIAANTSLMANKTGEAISVKPTHLLIKDRTESGVRTDYRVQTITGDVYNCSMTGDIAVSGRGISDPTCHYFRNIFGEK